MPSSQKERRNLNFSAPFLSDRFKSKERRRKLLRSFDTSKPVSRVLSFKTAIYLDALLPVRSSRPLNTTGPICCVPTALLRIEFTSLGCSQPTGELLPHLSTLTALNARRYLSVALFLGSPPADVIRYPCPAEPGLSSQTGLSPRPRGCPAYLLEYDTGK